MKNKSYNLLLLLIIGLVLVACSPRVETVIETVIVELEPERIVETVIVTPEPEGIEEPEVCCDTFRIGIFEEPVSLNYWHYFGLAYSDATGYVISDYPAHLFELSDQRFQLVPSLAKEIPTPIDNGDGTWGITVEMIADAIWSDGEPITAHDVVFTHNTCKNLALTLLWPGTCAPDGVDVTADVIDDFTILYTFHSQAPSVKALQAGIALAPILPQHFWETAVEEAYQIVESAVIPDVERPEDCSATFLSQADQESCAAWALVDEAYESARRSLYGSDPMGQPVAGGYKLVAWETGNYIEMETNPNHYFKGAEITEYEDGTWMRVMPDGVEYQLYGSAEGEQTLHFVVGPHNPGVKFIIYASQEDAYNALIAGEVDYVLNNLPLPNDLRERVEKNGDIRTYINNAYNMRYLAFNMFIPPMSLYEFRQALDILIDREKVITGALGGLVQPLYSTMPADNRFWHYELPQPYANANRADRIVLAVQVLKNAGWTWELEPYWDEEQQTVVPGVGLLMPDGRRMPELNIIGPDMEFDPIRASFNLWISQWARDLGMPVQSKLLGRDAILNTIFVDSEFDLYILGWSLANPAYPEYFDTHYHSSYCTIETGGKNAPCFVNEEYDALVEEFKTTSDLEHARDLIHQMQVLLADQRPYIPLYSSQVYDLARDNVIFPYVETLDGIEAQSGFLTDTQVLFTR